MVRGDPASGTVGRDASTEWAVEHAPFLASLALFLLIVIRVLRVAEYDVGTATTLIRSTGPVALVLGVLVTTAPFLVAGATVFLFAVAVPGVGTETQRNAAYLVALIGWLLLTSLVPWTCFLIVTASLFAVSRVLRHLGFGPTVVAVFAVSLWIGDRNPPVERSLERLRGGESLRSATPDKRI
jgi:hypothetical protein